VLEEVYYGSGNYILFSGFVTGSGPSIMYQIGWAVNKNWNVVSKVKLAVYDSFMSLLGSTNEVVVYNSQDTTIVGVLSSPVTLSPNTTYYMGAWMDTALFSPFSYPYYQPCMSYVYSSSGAWPTPFTGLPSCATIAIGGYGCTTTATATNNGGCSSSDSGLSKGAVAGVVIGVTIGSLLLLLFGLFLCFGKPGAVSKKGEDQSITKSTPGTGTESSKVELAETRYEQENA